MATLGAPATGRESLRTTCRFALRSSASISLASGIDGHGLLCVESMAANLPVVIFSRAFFGVALTLPWCETL